MKMVPSILFCLLPLVCTLRAETYHSVKISGLDFGAASEEAKEVFVSNVYNRVLHSRVNVRSLVECYSGNIQTDGVNTQGEVEVVFRLDGQELVTGFVDLRVPEVDGRYDSSKGFAFTFKPVEATLSTKERFEEIRAAQARSLADDHLPGSAWFRHLAGPEKPGVETTRWRNTELSDTFGIFSGGRAISENLALDRELILAEDKDGKTVPLSEIVGVTVKAIDWSSRMPGGDVKVDALSLSIPEDQHTLFAKNLPDLLALIERTETELLPFSQAYSVRNPFRRLASRYKKQMGLDVAAIAARLLPAKSVAVTGGDPFFPMGSDVAILMESDSPELLFKALLKVIESKASGAGATQTKLPGEGFQYRGFETKDRSFSSHLWQKGNVVAVSNSAVQITRLSAVALKKSDALGATDEFRFFRNRYPVDADETAFIFLSDAAIRRWSGPELRIAASRRTRAFAALGELTSQALAGAEVSKEFFPLLGETEWKDGKMISEKFGTMDFMKPASELVIDTVSVPEKDAYERWRSGYERGWSQAFDPIAISVVSKKDQIGFDLSVIPLTVDSDFAQLVQLCGKAKLDDVARWVPRESLLYAALALDTKGEQFKRYSNMMVDLLPGLDVNPLSWMSGSVSVDLEKSLFWEASFLDNFEGLPKVPLLVRIGSNSRLKLAFFMTALKTSIQGAAPGSLQWSTKENDGEAYAVVESKEEGLGTSARIYYATLSNALLVSLREDVLLRAIRREKHKLTAGEIKALPALTQMMLDSSPGFLAGLERLSESSDSLQRLRKESWKALPILNEWHRNFPGEDADAVQFRHFGEDIFCPGGKGYRWNPDALTMESVAFGFPASPRSEPAKMPGIMDYENVSTSLSFEDDGLRAGVTLGKAKPRLATPAVAEVEPVVLAKAVDLVCTKEGTVMVFKGSTYGSPTTWKKTIADVVTEGGKTSFSEKGEWITDGEEPFNEVNRYVLDGSLMIVSGSDDDVQSKYDQPMLDLPAELIAGKFTDVISTGISTPIDEDETDGAGPFRYESQTRVIGKEDIELPAGKFVGCIKLESAFESLEAGIFDQRKVMYWYYPGIGIVKYESTEGGKDLMQLETITVPGEGE